MDADWALTPEGLAHTACLTATVPTPRRRVYGLLGEPRMPSACPLVSCKILVMGKAGVGKTAVVAALSGNGAGGRARRAGGALLASAHARRCRP